MAGPSERAGFIDAPVAGPVRDEIAIVDADVSVGTVTGWAAFRRALQTGAGSVRTDDVSVGLRYAARGHLL